MIYYLINPTSAVEEYVLSLGIETHIVTSDSVNEAALEVWKDLADKREKYIAVIGLPPDLVDFALSIDIRVGVIDTVDSRMELVELY